MNAFEIGHGVEAESEAIIIPWMKSKDWEFGSHYPQYDPRGDYPITKKGVTRKLELKAERRTTGNLFIEHMSNANSGHARLGWFYTLTADLLMYHFLDQNVVHEVDVKRLQECELWIHYLAKSVTTEQHNKTLGWPVPVAVLTEMGAVTETYVL